MEDPMNSTPDAVPDPTEVAGSTTNEDTSVIADPTADPAQREWDRTRERDGDAVESDNVIESEVGPEGVDTPDAVEVDDTQIPLEDLPTSGVQPETQGEDPVVAELGEEGEGDLGHGDI